METIVQQYGQPIHFVCIYTLFTYSGSEGGVHVVMYVYTIFTYSGSEGGVHVVMYIYYIYM